MYKIYCIKDINGLEYIGKTKETLKHRLRGHRKDRNKGRYYSSSKLDLYNCEIILLEECEKDISSEREQYWMNQYPNRVNDYNAIFGSKKEWSKKYDKQYRINNKERIKERNKNKWINKVVKKCMDDIIDQVISMS